MDQGEEDLGNEERVAASLSELKTHPITATGGQDAVLAPIYELLMRTPADVNGTFHWFCGKATPVVIEAATFLLRLHAYSQSSMVDGWKQKMSSVLHGCCICVRSYQEIKVSSRDTYFGAFSSATLDKFFDAVENWELECILDVLKKLAIYPNSGQGPSDLSPALLYHILCSTSFLKNPTILEHFCQHPPCYDLSLWSNDLLPGFLILLFYESTDIRLWAEGQLQNTQALTNEPFLSYYRHIIQSVTTWLTVGPDDGVNEASVLPLPAIPLMWPSVLKLIRIMPRDILEPEAQGLSRVIISHLSDKAYFYDVFLVFVYLLESYGLLLWQNEDIQFPQVVFDSIKDNPSYINLILELDIDYSRQSTVIFDWFQAYLMSIRGIPAFKEVLKRLVSFACGELQHERFGDKRPFVMTALLEALETALMRGNDISSQASIVDVIDIHADVIVDIALSKDRQLEPWKSSQEMARRILRCCSRLDSSRIDETICQVAVTLREAETGSTPGLVRIRQPPFHASIWNKIYDTISVDDVSAISFLIELVSPTAHLDILNENAYTHLSLLPDSQKCILELVTVINSGLHTFRAGFWRVITQFTGTSAITTSVVQSLLRRGSAITRLIGLLLSPIEELKNAAQFIFCEAYNADVRSDCFREVLLMFPLASTEGLLAVLATFEKYGRILPEAGNFAKSVVRCMTDVIDVLTNGQNGLFFMESFMNVSKPAQLVPQLWKAMCDTITTIFRRTPLWSKVIDPDAMVDWMRDALIFARDLLAQRRCFETAATTSKVQSNAGNANRNPSAIGKQMLDDMQPILTESIRWLRLTDTELLHQSSNLILSLMECFREMGVMPYPDTLAKLEKFLDSARRVTTPEKLKTKLSERHLSELIAALSSSASPHLPASTSQKESSLFSTRINDVVSQSKTSEKVQATLDKFVPTSSKSVKAVSTFSRQVAPTRSHMVKSKSGPRTQSLMNQVRSQAAARALGSSSTQAEIHGKRGVPIPVTSAYKPKTSVDVQVSTAAHAKEDSDSSSSASAEEWEGESGLTVLGNLQKSPIKVKKPVERRTIKLLEPEFNTQNATLERIRKREEAQRANFRLKPDLRPLYRIILSWNYDHEGPQPPCEEQPTYLAIPNSFESRHEYHRIFEPLLILECWSQLIKSKEESPSEVFIGRINSRQYIDDWIDFDITTVERLDAKWRLSDMDIVILRNAEAKSSMLAKVQFFRRVGTTIGMTLRCRANLTGKDPGLHINTQWQIYKVFSLSTISREYGALVAFPYYDLHTDILEPRLALPSKMTLAQIQKAMKAHLVNEPQAEAILSSLQTEGFSLIQGPPGTGKTWTICGIIGTFMSSRRRSETVINPERTHAYLDKTTHAKVLVCAPSNAAIDEVTKRLRDGVRNSDGDLIIPNIVRVGTEDALSIAVRDLSLDRLVDQRLNADPKRQNSTSNSADTLSSLRRELEDLKVVKMLRSKERGNIQGDVPKEKALDSELEALHRRRIGLLQQLARLKDQQTSEFRSLDAARRKYRAEILSEADIICSTLSGAGHETLENMDFDIVIIDEAAQSVELSSLIPLRYRAKRCIMVGDPQQLPPTVLSPLANKYNYGQSLFLRLQRSNPQAVHLLSIQYRMHPDISRLPSQLFYENRLADGPEMTTKTSQAWHKNSLFGTYKFFNIDGLEQPAHSGHSLINSAECDTAVALYDRLKTDYARIDLDYRIGIISMYRAQLLQLKSRFQKAFGTDIIGKIDFNTVDGFQGQEKDIVILSCVRAGPGVQSIGFLSDFRRLNVAITRARSSLFILGHASTLERSDLLWKKIVQDAKNVSCFLSVSADLGIFRRSSNSDISCTPPKITLGRHTISPLPSDKNVAKDSYDTSNGPDQQITLLAPRKLKHPEPDKMDSQDGLDTQKLSHETALIPTASTISNNIKSDESIYKPPAPKPPTRKKPLEASLFIPKKKLNIKRPADESLTSNEGNVKRRLTDKYYQPGNSQYDIT